MRPNSGSQSLIMPIGVPRPGVVSVFAQVMALWSQVRTHRWGHAHLPHAGTIVLASYLTVGLSVLLHGLSAAPLVSRYATWYQAAADKNPPAMEGQPAHEHQARGLLRPP